MTTRLLRGMFIVGILHFGIGFFLYRGRVKMLCPVLFDSDLLVLFLPFFLALAGYVWVYWHSAFLYGRTGFRVTVASVFALLAVFISEWVTMALSIGLYGE